MIIVHLHDPKSFRPRCVKEGLRLHSKQHRQAHERKRRVGHGTGDREPDQEVTRETEYRASQ
ncbi:hypothetical protein DsansV1_C13g0124851 [Dioscorea sansibarensis]